MWRSPFCKILVPRMYQSSLVLRHCNTAFQHTVIQTKHWMMIPCPISNEITQSLSERDTVSILHRHIKGVRVHLWISSGHQAEINIIGRITIFLCPPFNQPPCAQPTRNKVFRSFWKRVINHCSLLRTDKILLVFILVSWQRQEGWLTDHSAWSWDCSPSHNCAQSLFLLAARAPPWPLKKFGLSMCHVWDSRCGAK